MTAHARITATHGLKEAENSLPVRKCGSGPLSTHARPVTGHPRPSTREFRSRMAMMCPNPGYIYASKQPSSTPVSRGFRSPHEQVSRIGTTSPGGRVVPCRRRDRQSVRRRPFRPTRLPSATRTGGVTRSAGAQPHDPAERSWPDPRRKDADCCAPGVFPPPFRPSLTALSGQPEGASYRAGSPYRCPPS